MTLGFEKQSLVNPRVSGLADYPFARLTTLLRNRTPPDNLAPLTVSVGEPQHQPPALLDETLRQNAHLWNRYPPVTGSEAFRDAAGGWLTRRYGLPEGRFDPHTALLPVAGTREALFFAALLAVPQQKAGMTPAVLMPNPFYAVYQGAAVMASGEPVFLPATAATGHLPDLNALPQDLLARTALFYLCSPANPQGAAASSAYLERAITLARTHGFVLIVDECYAELFYGDTPPAGALGVAACMPPGPAGGLWDNILVFHSLSKRSNAAGLRSGFVAGDPALMSAFARLRSYGNAGTPLPILAAAAVLWSDDAHVVENRGLYRTKFDAAARILGDQLGFYRPDGGFFLWLSVDDGEAAAQRLWVEAALRVLPGAYLTVTDDTGVNLGAPYIRVALVHPLDVVEDACQRLARTLVKG